MGEIGLIYHANERFEVFLSGEPVAEATSSPLRKVLIADSAGAELGLEQALDFRERIEPGKNGCGMLFLTQTAIYFLPKMVREAGDFAVTAHGLDGRVHDFLI